MTIWIKCDDNIKKKISYESLGNKLLLEEGSHETKKKLSNDGGHAR
jgi:hypothetical protein